MQFELTYIARKDSDKGGYPQPNGCTLVKTDISSG